MTKNMTKKDYKLIIILLSAVFFARFALTMYTPALPQISQQLNVGDNLVQLTVMVYMLAVGLVQFIYGPVSNAIGRRPVIIFGTALFIIGTVIVLFSDSINGLLWGRIIQGMGCGACPVMIKSMMRDSFKDKIALAKAFSIISGVGIMLPAIAPTLGGYIIEIANWRWIFVLLLIFAVIGEVLYVFVLKETYPDCSITELRETISQYKTLFSSSAFMGFSLGVAFLYSCELLYLSIAPFIFQNILHMTPSAYGLLILLPGVGFVIGIMVARKIMKRTGVALAYKSSAWILFIASISLISFYLLDLVTIISTIIPIILVMISVGISFNLLMAEAMHPVGHIAGCAAALIGTMQMGGSGLLSILVSFAHIQTSFGLGMSLLLCAVLFTLSLLFSKRRT